MDEAELILDYINGLKWFLLVSSVLIWLFWRYGGEIRRVFASLAQREVKVDFPWGAFAAGPIQPQEKVEPPNTAPRIEGETAARYRLLADRSFDIRETLYFEQVYRQIFGSQLLLLLHLKMWGPQPEAELEQFYQRYVGLVQRTGATQEATSFAEYLAFLFESELIESAESAVGLTDHGHVFLRYLSAKKFLLWKPL